MKKNIGFLVFVLIGVILIAVGGFLIYNISSNDENGINLKDIKDFSDYENFEVNLTTTKTVDGNDTVIVRNSTIDITNKIIKTSYNGYGVDKTFYYDLNNSLEYSSDDGGQWEKSVNGDVSLPDYSSIIDKVKTDSSVVDNGNNEFSLMISTSEETDENNVLVTVIFDNDGFLVKIIYDFSEASDYWDTYTDVYDFSNVNSLGAVTIPDDVVNNAIEGSSSTIISF